MTNESNHAIALVLVSLALKWIGFQITVEMPKPKQ